MKLILGIAGVGRDISYIYGRTVGKDIKDGVNGRFGGSLDLYVGSIVFTWVNKIIGGEV